MSAQKIFVIISSIINLALLGFAFFVLMNETGIGLFLTLFPLAIGLNTFFITKKIRNFELMRALKYFNIAYFTSFILPLGMLLLYLQFFPPRVFYAQPMYGVQMDPIMEQCYQKCSEIANQTSEAIRTCIEKCRK